MIPPSERPLTVPTQLTYRERWTVVLAMCGAAPVVGAIMLWPVSSRADGAGVGKVVALLSAAVAVTVAGRFRVAVVLNADRLLVRTWSTRAHAWADISSIVVEGSRIAVTSPSGTAYLPLGLTTPGRCEGDPALGQAVWAAWIERRGERWLPPPLDPWAPRRNLDDRVVLRNAARLRDQFAIFLVLLLGPQRLLDPTVPITDSILVGLAALGVAAGPLAFVHWRVALIIDTDEILVRWIIGARRIPRSIVLGVELVQPPRRVGGRATQRVRILTSEGYEPVPVPASGGIVLGHDPVFFRKLAWLDHTLRAPVDWAAAPDADH